MKMKALYVNHNDETFAELTHGQALDVIFNADCRPRKRGKTRIV